MQARKTVYEELIEHEGKALASIAMLFSNNTRQARDTIEHIVDHALKQLYQVSTCT